MQKELDAFVLVVKTASIAFNKISGRLLHFIVDQIGGPDKLGDDEVAAAIKNTMAFLGKKATAAFISQDQAELLLKLLQSTVPTGQLTGQPLPTAAEVARRDAAAKAADAAAKAATAVNPTVTANPTLMANPTVNPNSSDANK